LFHVQGHGDELCLADCNFPAQSIAEAQGGQTSRGPRIVYALGTDNVQMLEAVLKLMPLDQYVPQPVSEVKRNASLQLCCCYCCCSY
jgi:L-fucose mutarotase